MKRTSIAVGLGVIALVATSCGSTSGEATSTSVSDVLDVVTETTTPATPTPATTATEVAVSDEATGDISQFTAEVWADNWFALYVNGELVGEDSVSITTERSFNAETFTFEAAYPLTIAIEAKDFKETDSGLEYIGEPNQQMGDGGLIAQFTDNTTGETIAVTSGDWSVLVIHRAPLNTGCEKDSDPDATCEFEIIDAPDDWVAVDFDDSGWDQATTWAESEVSPKDGYDEISWDSAAELVWGSDLEVDNTLLLRTVVTG